jgi:hypothetical protein
MIVCRGGVRGACESAELISPAFLVTAVGSPDRPDLDLQDVEPGAVSWPGTTTHRGRNCCYCTKCVPVVQRFGTDLPLWTMLATLQVSLTEGAMTKSRRGGGGASVSILSAYGFPKNVESTVEYRNNAAQSIHPGSASSMQQPFYALCIWKLSSHDACIRSSGSTEWPSWTQNMCLTSHAPLHRSHNICRSP